MVFYKIGVDPDGTCASGPSRTRIQDGSYGSGHGEVAVPQKRHGV